MRGSRLTRRMLLRVAGGVIAATVMELRSSQARGGVIRRTSWFVEGPFPTAGQILTPVYPLPFSFRSVEVSWQASVPRGALLQLSVRLRSDGESWSDWIPLAADPHTPPAQDDGWTYAPPILASGRAVQLGIVCEPGIGGAGPRVEAIRVTAVEVSSSDMQWFASSDLIDGWIVPRAGWGADESLRFDENGKEIWPPRYAPIQKVIVHHTVTRNDPTDPAATIRAIYANIGGHRDYNITECPGDRLYAQLPLLRGMLKGTGPIVFPSKPRRLEPRAQLVSVTFTPASELYAGTLVRVDAVVRNVGPIELPTQGPPPGFIYEEGQTFDSVGFPKEEGAFRVGVDFEGNTGVPNPFRWGLPAPLPPGQEATVTGFIRLRSVRSWRLTASLVREYVRYEQQGVFPKDLTTLPPPTAPVPPSSDPNMIYFEVTQHNVPRVFYDYWRANGGLERFGYPLTEPFVEVSATDGQQYLVQYFERARFEHHPELAGTPFEVLLGLLGVERTRGRENEPAFRPVERPADPQIDYFVETRHTLRPPFQAYWWSRGGPAVFGYPISEPFEEVSKTDGQRYLVQYFERNRMEYHPELAGTRFEILLGHLGREALIDRGWLPGA
jgi:hypothetical protein